MSMAADAVTAGTTASRREEEEMTAYTRNDLDEGWEFKFLRASTSKFRDPVRLQEILTEEARAGWTLVEKFDDSKLRLKRPSSARAGDAALPFDPTSAFSRRDPIYSGQHAECFEFRVGAVPFNEAL
jgi:hypothetical protein